MQLPNLLDAEVLPRDTVALDGSYDRGLVAALGGLVGAFLAILAVLAVLAVCLVLGDQCSLVINELVITVLADLYVIHLPTSFIDLSELLRAGVPLN